MRAGTILISFFETFRGGAFPPLVVEKQKTHIRRRSNRQPLSRDQRLWTRSYHRAWCPFRVAVDTLASHSVVRSILFRLRFLLHAGATAWKRYCCSCAQALFNLASSWFLADRITTTCFGLFPKIASTAATAFSVSCSIWPQLPQPQRQAVE